MEASKKQADAITDMEEQLKNEKKRGKMYEEALDTLQAEMEGLHQDNAKLKQQTLHSGHERQGQCFGIYLRCLSENTE